MSESAAPLPLELGEISFSKEELLSIPKPHFAFLRGSSAAANDVAVFQRLLIQSTGERYDSELIVTFQNVTTLILLRNLSAKLVEYVNLLESLVTLLKRNGYSETRLRRRAERILRGLKAPRAYQVFRGNAEQDD
jgi:hypothetical protein